MESFLRYLSDLILPEGHLVVEYESEQWEKTRLSLGCGILPVATSLGSMFFRVGCGVAFKDWHFAEGGSGGPRKLPGHKALNEDHRRARAGEMAAELRSFLSIKEQPSCHQLWETDRERTMQILSLLCKDDSALDDEALLGQERGEMNREDAHELQPRIK